LDGDSGTWSSEAVEGEEGGEGGESASGRGREVLEVLGAGSQCPCVLACSANDDDVAWGGLVVSKLKRVTDGHPGVASKTSNPFPRK
jgi:hypothetical protein